MCRCSPDRTRTKGRSSCSPLSRGEVHRAVANALRRAGRCISKAVSGGSDEEANASQLAAFRDELAFVMRTWARAQTKTGHSKAFLYYFTHDPPPTAGATSRGGFGSGATHGSEAQYVFQNLLPPRAWTDLDHKVSDTTVVLLGELRGQWRSERQGSREWPAFDDRKSDRPMVLGDQAEVGPAPNQRATRVFRVHL